MNCQFVVLFHGDKFPTDCRSRALPDECVCDLHRDWILWANRPDIYREFYDYRARKHATENHTSRKL